MTRNNKSDTEIIELAKIISGLWEKDSDYFYSKINFAKSTMDNRAVYFMNRFGLTMNKLRRILPKENEKLQTNVSMKGGDNNGNS